MNVPKPGHAKKDVSFEYVYVNTYAYIRIHVNMYISAIYVCLSTATCIY